ncbi:hypothetical protein LTR85_010832 [Meristemomyces frigidus]|nr:hypothetical protein LTR85_010832 [Meristemomyces frigidus]
MPFASTSTTRATASEGADFLSLPPELRNRIYELAFTDDKPTEHTFSIIHNRLRQAPLTCTGRQIRNESLPMIYSINTIRILVGTAYQQAACLKWLEAIGPHIKLIRRLEIRVCGHANRYVLERQQAHAARFQYSTLLLANEWQQLPCRVALYGAGHLSKRVLHLNRALRVGDTGAVQMREIVESIFRDAKRKLKKHDRW